MARKALNLSNGFNYDGTGTGTAVESNAQKIDDNFEQAFLRYGITASEQMAPADTTVETANTQKLTIAAGTLEAGDRIVGKAWGKVTAANSTDLLTARVRIGNTGLTGTILAEQAAYNADANDIVEFDFSIFFERLTDSDADPDPITSLMHSAGKAKATGETEIPTHQVDITSVDTEAAIEIVFTQDWSVDNAGNRFKLYDLRAEILRD